jgi:hypothetical protein
MTSVSATHPFKDQRLQSDASKACSAAAHCAVRLFAMCSLAAFAGAALAQGGPPMVTDDPETPGDGHWEINVGAIAAHTRDRWEVAAPDADINYAWGDRAQLKLDVPWVSSRDAGEHWKSGVGDGGVGVKWRFLDKEQAGISVSTYPQYSRSLLSSSTRRGIASARHQFFLPLEFAVDVGSFGVAAEVGRNYVQGGATQWAVGVVAAHACASGVECMVEARTTRSPGVRQTLLNVGTHWRIDESLTVLAAVGREFGTPSDERLQRLFYLGVQITR